MNRINRSYCILQTVINHTVPTGCSDNPEIHFYAIFLIFFDHIFTSLHFSWILFGKVWKWASDMYETEKRHSLCNKLFVWSVKRYEKKCINHQVPPHAIFFTLHLINLSEVKLFPGVLWYHGCNLSQLFVLLNSRVEKKYANSWC